MSRHLALPMGPDNSMEACNCSTCVDTVHTLASKTAHACMGHASMAARSCREACCSTDMGDSSYHFGGRTFAKVFPVAASHTLCELSASG